MYIHKSSKTIWLPLQYNAYVCHWPKHDIRTYIQMYQFDWLFGASKYAHIPRCNRSTCFLTGLSHQLHGNLGLSPPYNMKCHLGGVMYKYINDSASATDAGWYNHIRMYLCLPYVLYKLSGSRCLLVLCLWSCDTHVTLCT